MGKRKFKNSEDVKTKKLKSDTNEVVPKEIENEDAPAVNRIDSFDFKSFRKEISSKKGQTIALNNFLQLCLNTNDKMDYILEYLNCGGNSHEILRQLSQDNKNNLTLATPTFHIFHLIILKVQSSLPHMISITEEACRYFLNTFSPTIDIMISENSSPRHRKIILNLLTSIVTLNPDLGIEVLNQSALTAKNLQYITEKSNQKDNLNVRGAFVQFITSFLVEGHLLLIKALLEKQGLLTLVLPGLLHDNADAVLMFLNILKNNVIDNSYISKSLKLKTFSHHVLHNMFKIYDWRGPPEINHDSRMETRPVIMELLSDIMLTLFTSHKLGLYFLDKSIGTSDINKNQNLSKALVSLKRPWENEYECETILMIIFKCPDLHRAIITVIENSFEPQHSPLWERCVKFVVKLANKLKPEALLPKMTVLSPFQMANCIRFLTLPVPLLKTIQTNLEIDSILSYHMITVLVAMFQNLNRYIQILKSDDKYTNTLKELQTKLDYFLPKHLPSPTILIDLIDKVMTDQLDKLDANDYRIQDPGKAEHLISLMDLLLLFHEVYPAFFENIDYALDMKKILEFSDTLKTENDKQTNSLLKFKVVSLWITLDNSLLALSSPMFKKIFLIMLEIYTNNELNIYIEAKDILYKFFKNINIFEGDEDEVNLIMYSLRNAKLQSSTIIVDLIEYVLCNLKELTNYLKNQIVNFEFSHENSAAQLDKLFDDLTEGKDEGKSYYLEDKIPSPFVVGCLQYLQTNKEVKKELKPFLSMYLAHLLHCNYSPELTEVFIGDTKLDARNYVASWMGTPISLPDSITGKDQTLKSISKSLIDDDEIPLTTIFSFLVTSSEEDMDLKFDDILYKIDTSVGIDKFQLFVSAKYLIYCIIQLTNLKKIDSGKFSKIMMYFEVIISTSMKHHMLDFSHKLMLALFRNPYFVKIYQPLDLGEENSLLATNFILETISKYRSVINYLDKKCNLLMPYQEKNCSEILKAFIKIKKKKDISTEHTLRVLEVVGIGEKEAVLIFNSIFNVELTSCVKENKEPTIVLEVLKILIYRYARCTDSDLSLDFLRNIVKLYTDLLINKELNPNLTELENSLIEYFECKPIHAKLVSDDGFKCFFKVKFTRKSISTLASVLLKLNNKFCCIFKEELKNQETLVQRELTIPMGEAILNHSQYLQENSDILTTIYNEYKTNILKVLEKPHKAGQIYISSWKFIKKILIECIYLSDAEKLFSKCNKYDVIEPYHMECLHAVFLKVFINSDNNKTELFNNYIMTMCNSIIQASKSVDKKDVIDKILNNINEAVTVMKLHISDETFFKKVIESNVWQNFCKVVLKNSLKIKTVDEDDTSDCKLLYILVVLVKTLYPHQHEDTTLLFDMVTAHSEFLNIMLSHHSTEIKACLVELLFVLVSKNESLMKSQQIPVYLSAYHALRIPCDRLLLKLLHFYETHSFSVNEFTPYFWGDSAASYYAVRRNKTTTLWSRPTPNQVLNLFEKDVIERTILHFPINQALSYDYELPSKLDKNAYTSSKNLLYTITEDCGKMKNGNSQENKLNIAMLKVKYDGVVDKLKNTDLVATSHASSEESIYDPAFLFPLLSHLLAPGSVASCSKMLRSGLLSVPVMGLSSSCPRMRAAACNVLHRFHLLLETETRHRNDKLLLTSFITTLRCTLSSIVSDHHENGDSPRIPTITALYLAKALLVYTAPMDPLYKPVNNFLIAKDSVDLTIVPDFLTLFHNNDVEAAERRAWILDVMKYGTRNMDDVMLIFKTMCLKMVMDFYNSVLSNRQSKEKILNFLSAVCAVPKACVILIEGYGFLPWLHCVVRNIARNEKMLIPSFLILIRNMLSSIFIVSFSKCNLRNGKSVDQFYNLRVKRDLEAEFSVILCHLLRHLDTLEDTDLIMFVETVTLLSKSTIKSLSKDTIVEILMKAKTFLSNDTFGILLKAVEKNSGVVLASKIVKECDKSNQLTSVLLSLLNMYLR